MMTNEIILEKISEKKSELNQIAKWRNETLQTLRTSDLMPYGRKQEEWVANLNDNEKYFFVYNKLNDFIGYCGLDKIHLANRTAEISLLIGTPFKSKHYGSSVIKELLEIGFDLYNLNLIFGEVYLTSTNEQFWLKCGFKKEAVLRDRKYWQGKYYDSIIFSTTQQEWREQNK